MPAIPFTWPKGETGALCALDGERIEVVSQRPEAPGSRPAFRLADGAEVRIKVHGCKREGDLFRIEGRVIDLTRAVRARVLAELAAP